MKKITNYLLILTAFISLNSCFSYKELQVKEVQSVKLLKMDSSSADLAVDVKILNPNNWKIKVKDCDLNAYINKRLIGKVDVDEDLEIKKKSENVYTLFVKADMNQVRKLAPSLMFNSKAIVNLQGDLKVKAKGISKKVNINVDEKISRKDLKNIMTAQNQ